MDIAFLGLAEFDPCGNVNVSRFGSAISGVGGFINISQSTPRVVFMGTLTAGGLQVAAAHGRLAIVQEGRLKKLVPRVQHLRFAHQQRALSFSFSWSSLSLSLWALSLPSCSPLAQRPHTSNHTA